MGKQSTARMNKVSGSQPRGPGRFIQAVKGYLEGPHIGLTGLGPALDQQLFPEGGEVAGAGGGTGK